jgi:sporulation protein YlmC with PRC-barrel domain
MTQTEHATEILGYTVIAHKEGAQMGRVSHVFVDPKTKAMSGLTFKSRFMADEQWIGVQDIELLGKDVILVRTEASAKRLGADESAHGRSLKELRGTAIVTMEGKKIGTLEDVDFADDGSTISGLHLNGGRQLAVEIDALNIGVDQVMVPAEYENRITTEKKDDPGFLRRVLGGAGKQDGAQSTAEVSSGSNAKSN